MLGRRDAHPRPCRIVANVHTKFLDPSLLCFTAVPLSELCPELGASSCMCIGGTHPHPNSFINITQLSFGRLFKVNAY